MVKKTKTAVFAGGCFWCMEPPFAGLDGVISVLPGYTGGDTPNPTYAQVCGGGTGHYEAVQIEYDPERISYARLIDVFFRQIDPEDAGGQFADRGTQYRTAIFYADAEQRESAIAALRALEKSGRFPKGIKTRILPAGEFYAAEEYHCRYFEKNPALYNRYKEGSGRAAYLRRKWGKA